MPDRELIITHLQIIHTWAEFARERDLQFFTKKHLEDIAQWSEDALALLKEQEAVEPYVDGEGNYCCKVCDTVVGWEELTATGLAPYVYKFCPMCGKPVNWRIEK